MTAPRKFNPLSRINLGRSVAEALLESQIIPLVDLKLFKGAGIYAIYYSGDHPLYEALAMRNRDGKFEVPIYVGKAIPAGGRKGGHLEADPGEVLFKRLAEHRESIVQAANLEVADFHYRALVVEDIWIPLGESLLIAKFAPLWNKIIDGFGNHDPGKGRYQGMRPRWDVLHPGRGWALKCQNRAESAEQIETEVKDYLASSVVPEKPSMFDEAS